MSTILGGWVLGMPRTFRLLTTNSKGGVTAALARGCHLPRSTLDRDQLRHRLPRLAVELREARLTDRVVVVGLEVDLHARQQHAEFHILEALHLLQEVLAREIVAAAFQHQRGELRT